MTDEEYARMLQEQEYGSGTSYPPRPRGGRHPYANPPRRAGALALSSDDDDSDDMLHVDEDLVVMDELLGGRRPAGDQLAALMRVLGRNARPQRNDAGAYGVNLDRFVTLCVKSSMSVLVGNETDDDKISVTRTC
jgi:hypothetical protein